MKKYLVAATATLLTGSALAVPVVLSLLTDDFAGESSFAQMNIAGGGNIAYDSFTGAEAFPGSLSDGAADIGDLLSATAYTFTWDLGPGDYVFTLFDSFGDGICCGFGLGSYSLSVDGAVVGAGGEFGFEESTAFTIDAPPSVSEPGTMLLFGLGIAGLALSRRLRRA